MGKALGSYTEDEVLALAQRGYTDESAPFAVAAADTALLVIDMQDEFVEPGWTPFWIPAATRMIPRLAALVGTARQTGVPVVHTAFAATHQGHDRPAAGRLMPNRVPVDDPDGVVFSTPRFPAALAPAPGEVVIHKPSYGAFYDTPLDTILRNLGRTTVIVTGTLTNLCCGTTARQAYERGYQVVFASDLTATNDAAAHEAELRTLRYGFARVMSGGEIAAELKGTTGG